MSSEERSSKSSGVNSQITLTFNSGEKKDKEKKRLKVRSDK